MDFQLLFAELQQRQEAEMARAHEGILNNDQDKEDEGYAKRSSYSEFEMWLDQAVKNNPNLNLAFIIEEIERRIEEFSQEAEKFYTWKTETTANDFRWQAEAMKDFQSWLQENN